jgi:hypothetical protein
LLIHENPIYLVGKGRRRAFSILFLMDIFINFDFKFCHGEMEKHFKKIIIKI